VLLLRLVVYLLGNFLYFFSRSVLPYLHSKPHSLTHTSPSPSISSHLTELQDQVPPASPHPATAHQEPAWCVQGRATQHLLPLNNHHSFLLHFLFLAMSF
jgi:hypothetical protein